MAKTVNKPVVEHTMLLDKKMCEAFPKDFPNDKEPVRTAIWDYYMEANDHDTMKTADQVAWELKASDDEITDWVKKNIKK